MSPEEVRDLIRIYGTHINSETNPNLWKEIAAEMNEKGHKSSWKLYRTKWNTLKTTYERKKKENKIAEPWPYYKVKYFIYYYFQLCYVQLIICIYF